ncbi:MAG: hypothetical protein V1901_01180, partial [Patescibacteria group bacterium]|nr:hypothetical protein [Patescibacteria group bacterium]
MEKDDLLTIYNNFLDYYALIDWHGIILPLKIISVILSIFLIFSIFFILFKIRKNIEKSLLTITESITAPGLPKKELDKKWQAIMDRLEKNNDGDYKMAIIEADNLFDDLLIRIGYQGEDMGERLKQITKAQLANIDELWQAHKIRNRIAHEQDFKLT